MGPIGVFDSGYGGLTILSGFLRQLPQYDYLYLGDNARTPYGNRSFETVYRFTSEAVRFLLNEGCPLIILACNTASAKALRTIQQNDLARLDEMLGRLYTSEPDLPSRRVLGVLRPTAEAVGQLTRSRHVGLLATPGTVQSGSYPIEIHKLYPDIHLTAKACPMWVPLVENGETGSEGAAWFVQKYLSELFEEDPLIDTLVLGCTHYPLLLEQIKKFIPPHVTVVSQSHYVSEQLESYLQRHPHIETLCSKNGTTRYLTTEATGKFEEMASIFTKRPIQARQVAL